MKKTVLTLSLAASLAAMSPIAHADLNAFLLGVHKQALSDIKKFNNSLSKQFGVPVPDVDAIAASVPKPEDVFMILQLSQMSHKPPEVVLEIYRHDHGKAWGALARELGIKPGSREFHALKRGELSFAGETDRDDERRGDRHGHERDHEKKRVHEKKRDHEREHDHGRGRGKGRDED